MTGTLFISVIGMISFCISLFGQTEYNCVHGTAIVNVLDQHGIPVRGLDKSNFKVSSGGNALGVLSANYSAGPRRVVILLDTSGSMTGATTKGEWKIARAVALDFANAAPPGTQLSLMTFASDIQQRTKLSGDRRPIVQWLNADHGDGGIRPKGPTALFEAVLASLKELDPTQPGDSIYVITDGGDNQSRRGAPKQIKDDLRGVRLFAFLLQQELNPAMDNVPVFLEIIKDSGGFPTGLAPLRTGSYSHYEYDGRAEAVISTLAKVMNAQVNNYYVISLDLARESATQMKLKIEAVDSRGRPMKDVNVTYPQHSSCSPN